MKVNGIRYDVILINATKLNNDIKIYQKTQDKRPLATLYAVMAGCSPSVIHHARARFQVWMAVNKPNEEVDKNLGYIEESHYLQIVNGFGLEDKYRTSLEDEEETIEEVACDNDYSNQLDFIQKSIVKIGDDVVMATENSGKQLNKRFDELILAVNRLGNCLMQELEYIKQIKDKVSNETSKKAN